MSAAETWCISPTIKDVNPRPWSLIPEDDIPKGIVLVDANGVEILKINGTTNITGHPVGTWLTARGTAEFILDAVNHYEELVRAYRVGACIAEENWDKVEQRRKDVLLAVHNDGRRWFRYETNPCGTHPVDFPTIREYVCFFVTPESTKKK